jgi:hypothetical protein
MNVVRFQWSAAQRVTAQRIPSGEGNAMATGRPSRRTEIRTPLSVISIQSFPNHTSSGTSSSFASKMPKRTLVDELGYGQS